MKKRCAVPVFLFPLLSCVFLTSCAVSENIPRDPASVSDTTASAMLTDGTTTAPTTTVPTTKPTEPDCIGSDQMAVQAVLDLFGTDGGTWIVESDGGSGQEGTLYVLGIADDTVLWHSCRPFACGNPPPAVGAVTSPESPDLLLLGDFVWDWTAQKTDAA